jgi:hypothetical protein
MRGTGIAAKVRDRTVNIVGKERPNGTVGSTVVGTKKEEKQNFRVRILHTAFQNYLIFFKYPSSPSWARSPAG